MAKDIAKTLIIGLGGTGQSVIRDIKKRLFRRYGEIPSLVKFLSIDTDANDYQDTDFEYYYDGENRKTKKYNISNAEFKKIARPTIDVLKNDPNCEHLNFEQLNKVYNLANSIGANGYRVMGRAHLLYNASDIMTQLENTVNSLRNAQLAQHEKTKGYQVAGNSINIYIIASLAGGTGSSSFLDLSRMLQHAQINILPNGEAAPSDTIFGVFFMPSFFQTKANTPNVKANTYVALSELDYLLGLNDAEKYPEGCAEKENDLNVYGHYTQYKSVRYSNVYIIDEKTKKGNTHNFAEASGYVASFIAASIAADNQAIQSSYSNSTHRLHDVEGKRQMYSGLGYCEIRFDRQNLVKYLLNKQLCEILNGYKSASLDFDKIANKFIEDNKLNEGVMSKEEGVEDTRSTLNELTDLIYTLDDRRFTSIAMGRVETGEEAAAQIEANKIRYLTNVRAQVEEAIKGFVLKKKEILKNLQEMLSKCQTEAGFGNMPDLAKQLKGAFEDMKLGLEDEIAKHREAEKNIEDRLKRIKVTIHDNRSPGIIFGFGNRLPAQKDAINAYYREIDNIGSDTTPTLLRLTLEIARKEEAVNVYGDLIKLIETFYKEEEVELGGDRTAIQISGSVTEVQQTYDTLKRAVETEFLAYSYSKSAKNETIFVDAYFKEYFDKNRNEAFELSDQARSALEEYVKRIFMERPSIDKSLIAKMREFLLEQLPENVLIKRIQREDLSIDQLFVHCFGRAEDVDDDHDLERYPHLGLFGQMDTLFDSLWQYGDFRGGNCQKVALQCVVGVCNKEDHLLDDNNGYKAYLPSGHNYQFINVGDPDRIIFILQETAVPGFKMSDAMAWKSDYELNKSTTYCFTDKRLEDIDLLFPDTTDEEAGIAWAYGWMFGLIASVNGRIQVKASQAYLTKNRVPLGDTGYFDYFALRKQKSSDLAVCYKAFGKDKEIYNDIKKQVDELLRSDQNGSIVKIAHWVNDGLIWKNRGKLRKSMNENEILVIQDEPQFLAKRFVRLNSSSTVVTLDQFGKIVYRDSLGNLAEAEKNYKAPDAE